MIDKSSTLPSNVYDLAGMLPPEEANKFLQLCYTFYEMGYFDALNNMYGQYKTYVEQLDFLRSLKCGDLLILDKDGEQVMAVVRHKTRENYAELHIPVSGDDDNSFWAKNYSTINTIILMPDKDYDSSEYRNLFYETRLKASKARLATKAEQVLYKPGDVLK